MDFSTSTGLSVKLIARQSLTVSPNDNWYNAIPKPNLIKCIPRILRREISVWCPRHSVPWQSWVWGADCQYFQYPNLTVLHSNHVCFNRSDLTTNAREFCASEKPQNHNSRCNNKRIKASENKCKKNSFENFMKQENRYVPTITKNEMNQQARLKPALVA